MKRIITCAAILSLSGQFVAVSAFDLPAIDVKTLTETEAFTSARQVPAPNPGETNVSAMQAAILARMSSNSLKSIALTLKGLINLNHSAKPSRGYAKDVAGAAKELSSDTDALYSSLKKEEYREAFREMVSIRLGAGKLRKLADSIKNEANYTFWSGPELIGIGNALDQDMAWVKDSGKIYSFVVPVLKDNRLRDNWEAFSAERKAGLNRWEDLTLKGGLSLSDLDSLLKGAAELKKLWELYQQSFISSNKTQLSLEDLAAEKKLKVCFFKKLEKETCVYKCIGGTKHEQPMQRPDPWDNQLVVPCPQIVLPF